DMEPTTLGNRPDPLAPLTRLQDFTDGTTRVPVSLRLRPGSAPDSLFLDAQAFEVDATGAYVPAPDSRPSRTPETSQTNATSSHGDTHTLNPGWVRKQGTYTADDFTVTGSGKPTGEGDAGDEYFDTDTGIGYRWDEGEVMRIARGKADEMLRILANSAPL